MKNTCENLSAKIFAASPKENKTRKEQAYNEYMLKKSAMPQINTDSLIKEKGMSP
jgi:hypothetical protein